MVRERLKSFAKHQALFALKRLRVVLAEPEDLMAGEHPVRQANGQPLTPEAVAPAPEPQPEPEQPAVAAEEESGPWDDGDALLMSSFSGDLGPMFAARAAEAREESTGGAPVAVEEEGLKGQIIEALHTIYDPEIPVDIYELGLIYEVNIDESSNVDVIMTLTSPNCPAAQSLPEEVELKVAGVDGVEKTSVEVVFDPPWGPERMSEEARLELNLF